MGSGGVEAAPAAGHAGGSRDASATSRAQIGPSAADASGPAARARCALASPREVERRGDGRTPRRRRERGLRLSLSREHGDNGLASANSPKSSGAPATIADRRRRSSRRSAIATAPLKPAAKAAARPRAHRPRSFRALTPTPIAASPALCRSVAEHVITRSRCPSSCDRASSARCRACAPFATSVRDSGRARSGSTSVSMSSSVRTSPLSLMSRSECGSRWS